MKKPLERQIEIAARTRYKSEGEGGATEGTSLDLGKAFAGVPFMNEDGQLPAKYITPFSEMVRGIVNECKKSAM